MNPFAVPVFGNSLGTFWFFCWNCWSFCRWTFSCSSFCCRWSCSCFCCCSTFSSWFSRCCWCMLSVVLSVCAFSCCCCRSSYVWICFRHGISARQQLYQNQIMCNVKEVTSVDCSTILTVAVIEILFCGFFVGSTKFDIVNVNNFICCRFLL